VLDKALLRPGRFDRRVIVNLPDKAGREAILKVHTRSVPLAERRELRGACRCNAGILRGRPKRTWSMRRRCWRRGVSRTKFATKTSSTRWRKIVLGPERPLLLSRADKERIAYHEGGHAILGLVSTGADPVNRVTIVPRGQALGVT